MLGRYSGYLFSNEKSRILYLAVIVVTCQLSSFAQETSEKNDSADRSLLPLHSIYLTQGYNNNLVLGSSVSHKQSFYSLSLSYFYRNSLYLNLSSFHPIGYRFSAFNALSAGYYHEFGPVFDISLSLTGYKFPENLQEELFRNMFSADIIAGFDFRLLYTELTAGFISGESSSGFYSLKNSRDFQISMGKWSISVRPYAELLFGSLLRVNLSGQNYTIIKSDDVRWRKSSLFDNAEDDDMEPSPGGDQAPGSDEGGNQNPGPDDGGNQAPGPDDGGNYNPAPDDGGNYSPGPDEGGNYNPEPNDGGKYNPEPGDGGNQYPGTDDGENPNPGAGGATDEQGSGKYQESPALPGKISDQTGSNTTTEKENGRSKGAEIITGNVSGSNTLALQETIETTENFFGIMEVNFGLPVSFSKGKFIFEIEPGYVFPMYQDPYALSPQGLTFSFYLYINLF